MFRHVLPSSLPFGQRITGVENLNRLGHDVGTNGEEWGCFKLYVNVFLNYLWIEIIITVPTVL